jgi:hypothetical protein
VAEIDENIEQAEEDIPSPPTDEDVVLSVSYLVDALDKICELDSEKFSKVGLGRLRRIKRRVFNALLYYSEILPEPGEKPKPEDDEED